MIHALAMLLLAASAPADARAITGAATAVSGDTLTIGSSRVRLEGVAAPRIMQHCRDGGGATYPCGREAQAALAGLVEGRAVRCALTGEGSGACTVAGRDIGADLIDRGLAVPSRRAAPRRYERIGARAAAARRGIWRGPFVHPEQWDEAIRRNRFVRPSPPPAAVTGGPGPAPSVEGGYNFRCESMSGRLRWREDRPDIDSVPTLRDALRVTLLELSVVGHDLPDPSLARVRALMASFAWVERVHILCDDQNAHIELTAMRANEWIDFVEDRRPDRPPAHSNTINIARNGTITIDGPAF